MGPAAARFAIHHQRTDTDCSVCCTAMALRLSYERVLELVGDDLGWDGERFERVFEALGFDITFQPRVLRPGRPAILSVPSRLKPGHAHAVYCELGRLYDPTTKATAYSLGSALASAKGFFQWEPLALTSSPLGHCSDRAVGRIVQPGQGGRG